MIDQTTTPPRSEHAAPTAGRSPRLTRRRFAAAGALAPIAGLALARVAARGQDVVATQTGDRPTTGGMRPGPAGMAPAPVTRNRGAAGVVPVAIRIDRFGIDAPIEILEIVGGIMQDPRGPFIVSWYRETARLGEVGNVVLAGHVDYWNVGPAVFAGLKDPGMQPGDVVGMTGDDGGEYLFETAWSRTYGLEELTDATIQDEIVGTDVEPAGERNLTLITCGGGFDPIAAEYDSRIIVRLTQIDV